MYLIKQQPESLLEIHGNKEEVIKKLLATIILICTLGAFTIGCDSYTDVENQPDLNENSGGGYFTTVKKWESSDAKYAIVYANDSKVKYLIIYNPKSYTNASYDSSGITPLYNADGSLQVYDGTTD